MYQACLVACGYSEVPGIDFFENYSPVVNNITFCILLLGVIHFGFLAKIVNVENAFLYGDLDKEIYMEFSQGISDVGKDNCIILNKSIYDIFQAAWQYYKKAVKILKKLRFSGDNVNPCLYFKKSKEGIVYVALCIDDN